MARATVLLNVCAFFLLIGLCNCTLCVIFNPPIELYVFRRLPPSPNATVVFVSPPGSNGTAPVGVPVIGVADNPVRRTPLEGSPIVGYVRSLRISGLRADDAFRTQVTAVLDLQTSNLNGTISYAGIQTSLVNFPPEEELAVTGGTVQFRATNGYIKSSVVSNSGGLVILKFLVYLCI